MFSKSATALVLSFLISGAGYAATAPCLNIAGKWVSTSCSVTGGTMITDAFARMYEDQSVTIAQEGCRRLILRGKAQVAYKDGWDAAQFRVSPPNRNGITEIKASASVFAPDRIVNTSVNMSRWPQSALTSTDLGPLQTGSWQTEYKKQGKDLVMTLLTTSGKEHGEMTCVFQRK